MPKNSELIKDVEALSSELGFDKVIDLNELTNRELVDEKSRLVGIREEREDNTEDAETFDAIEIKEYFILPGKSIITRRGVRGPGQSIITGKDCDEKSIKKFIEKGYIK